MKKRITALLLALCLCLPTALAAGETYNGHSGALGTAKLSQDEIRALFADASLSFPTQPFNQTPSSQAPYAIGELTGGALTVGAKRFNALRRLAGLAEVLVDPELNQKAQYGAVLLAATGELNHHPQKPADMEAEFYQKGHNGTSSSNIYMGTGATLPQAIDAFFYDSDAGNLPNLGHRRWMLNPTMSKTGYGFSPSTKTYGSQTYNFAAVWAFDREGAAPNYDFIAWPSSGYFPTELFKTSQGWSVTLNPDKYEKPQLSDLTVTVQQEGGELWQLSGSRSYSPQSGPYLGVDGSNYGVDNCIIFRPEIESGSYSGVYRIAITGLTDKKGQAASLRYTVNFFSLEKEPEKEPEAPTDAQQVTLEKSELELMVGDAVRITAQVTPESATGLLTWTTSDDRVAKVTAGAITAISPGTVLITARAGTAVDQCKLTVVAAPETKKFSDVPSGSWFASPVGYVTRHGLFEGVGGSRFDPDGAMTRAMVMTVLARLDGVNTDPGKGETWDIRGKRWAVSNRISDGLNADGDISLEELAVMLYRYAQLRADAKATESDLISGMPDGPDVSSWAVEGMNWAVQNSVLQGDENRRLHPQRNATRAQVAAVIQRYKAKLLL